MSLDNIQLPPIVIQELFKKTLIDSKIEQIKTNSSAEEKIVFLGKNERQVIILVNDKDNLFLPDDDLKFLTGILTACKLTLNDVAIINIAKNPAIQYELIQQHLKAAKVFAFDVPMKDIGLPLQFPAYQIQLYNETVYLHAPSLQFLKNNKEEKSQLWASLQKIFFN